MSNYTKSTNFTAKDSLPTGDTNKVIRGSEFDTEFNALSTAIATKADLAGPTFTGTATFANITATGTINLTGGSVTTNIDGGTIDGVTIGGSTPGAGTFSSLTATTADINAGTIDNTVIGGATPAAGTFTAVAGTTGTFSGAVSGTTGTFSGAVTGSNLNVSNWDTAFGWGNHASAGYLTSVAFSDLDAGAVTLSSETFSDVDTQVPTNAAVIDYVAATIPLITEVNDLSTVVTWANVPDANITESSVTQHQAALSIATSQLTGGLSLSDITDVTATAAEVNYTDGVTSNIQTQLDSKVGANYTGDVNITGELLVDSYNETFKKVSSASGQTGFRLSSAAYDSKSFSIASQSTGTRGLAFKSDGTKMFVVATGNSSVYQYSLSTAWDVSTASYDSVSFSIATQDTATSDVNFKSDGTVMYVIGDNNDTIYQYTLSTAWDLSTASYASISFSLASQETQPEGVVFKTDGTKMFIVGGTEYVHEYALSTAWDVSTASYTAEIAVTEETITATGLDISSDGTTMFVIGFGQDTIFKYTLSTAWDITSATYDSESFSAASQEATPYGLRTGNNGTKTYIVGNSNNTVYQYSTATTIQIATFDCENANVFETVLSGNTTVAFSNPPAAGTATDSTAYAMSLKVVQDSGASGYTVTWPTSVDWPAATAPTLTATASAVDQFVFYTYDGGTTWYGFTAGQALG
jgi:sugar lactone lactonase YvrE